MEAIFVDTSAWDAIKEAFPALWIDWKIRRG